MGSVDSIHVVQDRDKWWAMGYFENGNESSSSKKCRKNID
jgi:hypothetical protein